MVANEKRKKKRGKYEKHNTRKQVRAQGRCGLEAEIESVGLE